MASSPQAVSPPPPPALRSADRDGRASGSSEPVAKGLCFDVAESVARVEQAWELVYKSYLREGLIDPNAARIHCVPEAIGPNTAVVQGRLGELAISTLSAYLDGPLGLPLDSVYPDELKALRDQGKVLMEYGLFADRREHLFRSTDSLLELMRFATYFGVHLGVTDAIVGVHPHHVKFYTRLLAFDVIGPERNYSLVKEHPVILLRMDWHAKIKLGHPPRALAHFMAGPVTADAYEGRVRFDQETLVGSRIDQFLRGPAADGKAA
jgi:hypothetical protein